MRSVMLAELVRSRQSPSPKPFLNISANGIGQTNLNAIGMCEVVAKIRSVEKIAQGREQLAGIKWLLHHRNMVEA